MMGWLKPHLRSGLSRFWGGLDRLGLWRASGPLAAYIVERGESWSIRWDGEYYAKAVNTVHPGLLGVCDRPERLAGRIAHFGSQFVWELWAQALHPSNRQIVTYFHGKPEDGPEMARHVTFFLSNLDRLEKIVTAASHIESRLLSWGVPKEKLALVPLGVDTALFHPPSPEERLAARQAFGVPEGRICIGSFQKDGVGWGEGLEPKLIKGPDLFLEAVGRLAKRFPLFVLLTGPARGFVKAGLERLNIPYRHVYLEDYLAVAQAYRAIDLYLMTSREEGGPKALLESLASGTALVSARVGMADDLFPDPQDPRIAQAGDAEGLAERAERLLGDEALRRALCESGRRQVLDYDWSRVGNLLYERVYRDLLADGRVEISR
jgi:glycosyltransferase involved in cell wall biosynthesis